MLGVAVAAPAAAQSVQFSAIADAKIGYGTNPFLAPGVTEGSIFANASIEPRLSYQTARSTTALDAKYSRDTYLHDFGYSDTALIGLIRTDQITQFLTGTITANFQTSNRDTIGDPNQEVSDPLDIGRRTRTLSASDQLQWQATARDQLSLGGQFSHQSYGGGQASGLSGEPSDYTQYGTNASFNHVLDARTSVGAQVMLSSVQSKIYPNSRTIQPALTVRRQLSAAWEVDGHVGVVLSHTDGTFARSSTSLGLGLNICGTYPRSHMCVHINRDTAPSGYGPLRTTTGASFELTQNITEHTRVTLNTQYVQDSSGVFSIPGQAVARNSKAVIDSAEYDHDLSERISAGFGADYRFRSLSGYSNARSYQGTIHIRAKLGRI